MAFQLTQQIAPLPNADQIPDLTLASTNEEIQQANQLAKTAILEYIHHDTSGQPINVFFDDNTFHNFTPSISYYLAKEWNGNHVSIYSIGVSLYYNKWFDEQGWRSKLEQLGLIQLLNVNLTGITNMKERRRRRKYNSTK